jgi:hypothetical protein
MIIIQVRETVQPEITKDHRVKIEPDEVAEAKAGEHEERRHKRKGRYCGNRDVPPGRIKEDVKRGGSEGDRKSVIGGINQRCAANDNMNANQQAEPEAFALLIHHASIAIICGGTFPRSEITQSAHNPQVAVIARRQCRIILCGQGPPAVRTRPPNALINGSFC